MTKTLFTATPAAMVVRLKRRKRRKAPLLVRQLRRLVRALLRQSGA